jgi:UDP-N-acetyl-D-galactosamine dehydrogenase
MVENAQRDLNIAFVNEVAVMCHRMKINTKDVLKAACTKWNFHYYKPGMVGGHCIPVDPHYLAFAARGGGVDADMILSSRKRNDSMPEFIAESIMQDLWKRKINPETCNILLFGLTFKANCRDVRNSPSFILMDRLVGKGLGVTAIDPLLSGALEMEILKTIKFDTIIMAVGHDAFKECSPKFFRTISKQKPRIFDLSYFFDTKSWEREGMSIWHL